MSTEKRTEETGSPEPPASSLDYYQAASQDIVFGVECNNQKLQCSTDQGDQALCEQRIPHKVPNAEESSDTENSLSDILSFQIFQNVTSQPHIQTIQNVSDLDKKSDLMSSEDKLSKSSVSPTNDEISAARSNVNAGSHYQQRNFTKYGPCAIRRRKKQPTRYRQKQCKSFNTVDDTRCKFKVIPMDIYGQRMNDESLNACPEQLPGFGYGIPSRQYSEVSALPNHFNSIEVMKWLNSINPSEDGITPTVKTPEDIPRTLPESIGNSFSETSLEESVLSLNNISGVQIDSPIKNERFLPSYKHLSPNTKFIRASTSTSIESPTSSYSENLPNKSELQCYDIPLTQNQEHLQESSQMYPLYGTLMQQNLFQIPEQPVMQQNLLGITPQQEILRMNHQLRISKQIFLKDSLRELEQSLVNPQQRLSQVVRQDNQVRETLHQNALNIASQQQEGTSQNTLQLVSQLMNTSRLMIEVASHLQELLPPYAQIEPLRQGFSQLVSQQGSVVGTTKDSNNKVFNQQEKTFQIHSQQEGQQNAQVLQQEEQQEYVQAMPQEESLQKPNNSDYPVPHKVLKKS